MISPTPQVPQQPFSGSIAVSNHTVVQQFNDFEQFGQLFPGLNCSILQTSPGPFSGSLQSVSKDGVTVFEARTNQSIYLSMQGRNQYLIIPVTPENANSIWGGFRHQPGTLLVVNVHSPAHVHIARDSRVTGLMLPGQLLHSVLQDFIRDKDQIHSVLRRPARVIALQRFNTLQQKLTAALDNGLRTAVFVEGRLLPSQHAELLEQAIRALQYSVPVRTRGNSAAFRRARLFRNTAAMLTGLLEQPLNSEELCSKLQIPASILRRAFLASTGVAPLAWFRLMRMHAVRRTLKTLRETGDLDRTVAAVARKFGFHRLGTFAQDYTRLFGERPSWTLGVRGKDRDLARSNRRARRPEATGAERVNTELPIDDSRLPSLTDLTFS